MFPKPQIWVILFGQPTLLWIYNLVFQPNKTHSFFITVLMRYLINWWHTGMTSMSKIGRSKRSRKASKQSLVVCLSLALVPNHCLCPSFVTRGDSIGAMARIFLKTLENQMLCAAGVQSLRDAKLNYWSAKQRRAFSPRPFWKLCSKYCEVLVGWLVAHTSLSNAHPQHHCPRNAHCPSSERQADAHTDTHSLMTSGHFLPIFGVCGFHTTWLPIRVFQKNFFLSWFFCPGFSYNMDHRKQ